MKEELCPLCDGDGYYEYEVFAPDFRYGGELIGKTMTCETCDGTGYIQRETEED